MKIRAIVLAAALGSALVPMAASATDNKPDSGAENAMERAGDRTADAALTTRIKARLVAEDNLSALDINVDTSNGVVTLSGDVDNEAQVDLAEKVVEDIDGVKSVHNKLQVKES